ncbi:MAG: response regulator transcription factor [Lachnospiraceae bacterium]|nr:response regulator transcription factor [Lachnospiraceae bacterium]
MKNSKECILVVEDESRIRRMLKDFLTLKGYYVLQAEDGEEALDVFYENNQVIDLVLLDIMLPKLDGYGVLSEIRSMCQVPVIMLTAKDAEQDQVEGFDLGADDYILKPFSNAVLLGHIEAVLKRSSVGVGRGKQQVGLLTIDSENKRVFLHDEDIGLTAKEYSLLAYFLDNPNVVVLRENILNQVWGYNYVGDTRTVDTHIKQLRSKLTGECAYIKTVHGFGYRFELPENEE